MKYGASLPRNHPRETIGTIIAINRQFGGLDMYQSLPKSDSVRDDDPDDALINRRVQLALFTSYALAACKFDLRLAYID